MMSNRSRQWNLGIVVIAGMLGIGGCATDRDRPTTPPPDWLTHETQAASGRPYVLRSSDRLSIRSARWQPLNLDVRIDKSGDIQYPYIGKVHLDGLTLDETLAVLEERLAPYYKKPRLTINLLQERARYAYVLGEVEHPGKIPLDGNTTLIGAMGAAGGHTTDAELSNVAFMRISANQARGTVLDLREFEEPDVISTIGAVQLVENDVVYVPSKLIADVERFFIRLGHIVSPLVEIQRGIILYPELTNALSGDNSIDTNIIISY